MTIDDLNSKIQNINQFKGKLEKESLIELIDMKQFIRQTIPKCFLLINYVFSNITEDNNYEHQIIETILNNNELIEIFEKLVNKEICGKMLWDEFLTKISFPIVNPKSGEFISIYEAYVKSKITSLLSKFILVGEKNDNL